jgi:hypothetical protein
MLTDSILRLKAAFANIPMRGLFFWEGLLFLKDEEYKKIVEGRFIDIVNSFPKEEQEATAYYWEILEDLRVVRKDILSNPGVRGEVEKIREALISEAAHETIIDAMRDKLSKSKS